MSTMQDPGEPIGRISHYYSHLSVAAIRLDAPLNVGQRIRIKGHTTDLVQIVESLEVEHRRVERAVPGEDVALKVQDHVREHDVIYAQP